MTFPVTSDRATAWPTNSAAANPAYSGVFIPTLWAGKIVEKFYAATVLAGIANTDYAGDISGLGDKVVIRTKPDVAISPYTADLDIGGSNIQRPSSASVELLIDKGYFFNTILDDVMEVQADLDLLSMWSDDASEKIKIRIDTDALVDVVAGAAAENQGATAGVISGNIDLGATGTPLVVTGAEALDVIIRAGQVLDEQNIPEQGRWMVIPAWLAANIKRSELRDASLTGDGSSMARNGRLGMIDRFTLYMSNLLPTATETGTDPHQIPFGHATGFTFASQMTKMETLRAESTFGTILRGLQVSGWKVTDPTAIGFVYARPTT